MIWQWTYRDISFFHSRANSFLMLHTFPQVYFLVSLEKINLWVARPNGISNPLENLCYNLPMPPLLRASEIGSYLYCRRAWWYRKQGVESENRVEMATGTELHRQHGRKVLAAGLLRTVGLILLLTALVLLVAVLTSSLLK